MFVYMCIHECMYDLIKNECVSKSFPVVTSSVCLSEVDFDGMEETNLKKIDLIFLDPIISTAKGTWLDI